MMLGCATAMTAMPASIRLAPFTAVVAVRGWLLALTCITAGVSAQTLPAPQNVLSLSAQATMEVVQDYLSISLVANRDGADSSQVQSQLRQLLEAALVEARKAVRPGQLDLRTGYFSVFPRYGGKGAIAGWQGSAELVIEGKDTVAISQLAGRLPGMVVGRISQGLSREAREHVEAEVTSQAIQRFKSRAEAYAKQFGFGGYSIREVSVAGLDQANPGAPMFRQMAMATPAALAEAQPVEAGKTQVIATVSGSIQMSAR